jgi:hypothetical protein
MWATVFDPVSETATFLEDVIAEGWPIFLAIVGGLVAITLAAAGIRTVFRRVAGMLVGDGSYTAARLHASKRYRHLSDEAWANKLDGWLEDADGDWDE